MNYLNLAVFCLIVFVQEISSAPVDQRQYIAAPSALGTTKYGKTEVSPVQNLMDQNYQPGTPYADPCNGMNTGSYGAAGGYGAGYGTGYGGYPCSTTGAGAPADLFNRKVELVAVKDFHVKNGKVVPPTNIIQG